MRLFWSLSSGIQNRMREDWLHVTPICSGVIVGTAENTVHAARGSPSCPTQPKAFQMWVNDMLVGSQTTSRAVGQHEVCPTGPRQLSAYQKFAGDYVARTHKSLLAYWCTGSGKTALAISIMSNLLPLAEADVRYQASCHRAQFLPPMFYSGSCTIHLGFCNI